MKLQFFKYYSTLFLWMMCFFSFAQTDFRDYGFAKPMNLPFNLAGCFGEPRKDHFHSGIDIKTNGVEGESVAAIHDGYISRIKVSPYGYGKAIYITHANGFTSVYGHLSRFNEAIEKYVHAQHYASKKSELDVYLNAGMLPVKRNETIAFSGNTGGSGGPHLHFEIRDTKSEHALNPLEFYPNEFYEDTIPPTIRAAHIYYLKDGYYSTPEKRNYPLINHGNHLATGQPIVISSPEFGIALQGFDKQYDNENKNGIDRIVLKKDAAIIFQYTMNEVDFDKTRMVSAFMDYEEQQKNGTDVYQCFRLPNNTLPVYDIVLNSGHIAITDTQDIMLECYDFNRNSTEIRLTFIRKDESPATADTLPSFSFEKRNILKRQGCMVVFPENCFYDNIKLNYSTAINSNKSVYSTIHKIGDGQFIPLHKSCLIEIKSTRLPKRLYTKAVMVRRDFKGRETALESTFRKGWVSAGSKDLGDFYIKADTTAPRIELLNFKEEAGKFSAAEISVRTEEQLSGIATYNGYIDGQWINFYYDAKNDTLTYLFDEYCPRGEHILKLTVTDKVGNKTILQKKFNY